MAPGITEKKNNILPLWGNDKTMNLNNLILTNILSSHYFKVNLYQLKTYHEVIDEIYYQVTHLEPWEKGSRKTSGQTGMCGGVRGVGAGGIVSTAFCILYKLFTLKLTRKQVVGLINHADSAYIRALGFMYIRYTQPPVDLWDWYESYLSDEEELDVKAGGGQMMSIGEMLRHFLSKLEWFSTLFPRIPVPIQKDLERKLTDWRGHNKTNSASATSTAETVEEPESSDVKESWNDATSNLRSTQDPDPKIKNYVDNSKEKFDVAEEIARERERQKKEKDKPTSSTSHHRSSEHHKDHGSNSHRSRSPLRISRTDDPKRHTKKHHEKEREHSERKHHKSHEESRHKEFTERDGDSRHIKIKSSSRDHRKERKHAHSHSHNHSKRHEKHSHSRSHEHY